MATPAAQAWAIARQQHGVVTRQQLQKLGFSPAAIRHRIAEGRLHPYSRGVYVVGRPELSRYGRWMAAVLGCGPGTGLSHRSAAALWGIAKEASRIEVSVPAPRAPRRPGIVVHRRADLEITSGHGIRVTPPVLTLIDLAALLPRVQLERAINEADRLDLTDPEALRAGLPAFGGRPGAAPLRRMLDRLTFTLTDSDLEQRFLPLARAAGLPQPLTGWLVNGFKVDFWWPDLRVVVETDGLRYHRTPAQQARDRVRDQTHTAAGLVVLRFTHAQVAFEPEYVRATLADVARRLRDTAPDANTLRMGAGH